MILALLLLAQAAPAAPAPEDEHEIVVIGEQLERWQATIRFEKSGGGCTIKQSTGDAEIDRIGCDSTIACFPRFQAHFEASRSRKLTRQARSRMNASASSDLAACIKSERSTRIAALVSKRRETGQ